MAFVSPPWLDSGDIRRQAGRAATVGARSSQTSATSVASLFYLVPATTALMAYLLFGEQLDAVAIAGMIACAAAV